MKTYTPEELKGILEKHLQYLRGEVGGQCADLSSANLSYADLSSADLRYANLRSANLSSANLRSADLRYADLRYADLRYANLRYADLSSADLRSADLSYANLRYADLSYANLSSANLSSADLRDTRYENINWLAYIGIVPDSKGKARAYKVITKDGEGIQYSGVNYLKSKTVEGDRFDDDVNAHCSHGINLATFEWCLNNKSDKDQRLLIMEFVVTPENVCVPIATDGKFRVKKATRLGECDWQGNLLKKAVA